MKQILVIFLLITVLTNISSAQTGWGYVNYTSYKTHNGNGSTNQYSQFANNAAGFDVMFNTANSNTTITHTGETAISNLYNGSYNVPRWNNDYFGYKFEFWFVPKETGTYYFGINSDDASDLSMDGTIIVTYYGGHGASSWQTVARNLVAGQKYKMVYRGQEYGGGEAFYFMWYRPSGGWGFWNDEVTNQASVSLNLTFDFGQSINRTNFTTKLLVQSNNQYLPTTNTSRTLSNLGNANMTSDLDTIRISNGGFKALTTGGQVEWCVIYDYDISNQRYRIGIDKREFTGTNVASNTVTNLKLFDLWDGPVTFKSDDGTWAEYWINTTTQFNFASSANASKIRQGNGFYGVSAEFTFSQSQTYKSHGVELNTTNILSLYNSVVTVSDVFIAFKELSNNGLFGNQNGLEFTNGVQFMNADVDENGIFDERDTYKLLQHLTGQDIIGGGSTNLSSYVKILPKSQYDQITKLNWNTVPNTTNNVYTPIILSNISLSNNFTYNIFWKGDVNMSHSASLSTPTPRIDQISDLFIEAEIWTELKDGMVYAYINVNPINNKLSGAQFALNYDNTILEFNSIEFITSGNPINFSNNRGTFISLGSIINNGNGVLDNKTEYIIKFKPKMPLEGSLGLVSINSTDAVSSDGVQLSVKLK